MPYLVLSLMGNSQQIDGSQNTGAKHPWYSRDSEDKSDLASFICKPVKQTYIVCQISNVDAMVWQVSFTWSMIRDFE